MIRFTRPAWFIAACLGAAGPALADGDRFPLDPAYREECGSCHVAYPPKLLPQAGWRSTMASLDRHFGSDASVEPALARRLDAYLQAHAGRERGAGDEAAQSLMRRAAGHIAELVEALFMNGAPQVALVGGLADALRDYMPGHIAQQLAAPQADAMAGAILLAKKKRAAAMRRTRLPEGAL